MRNVQNVQPDVSANPASLPLEIVELTSKPDDAVLESVAAVLRDFYEVEAAAFAMVRRGDSAPTPLFALRVHNEYRGRVGEIFDAVLGAAAAAGLSAEVLFLQDRQQILAVRAHSLVFFPWRRRS